MKTGALIIIAKYPEKGKVKTRLKGHLTDDRIVELYKYLLNNTVRKLKAVPGIDTFIAFAPEGAGDYFAEFGVGTIALPEGDLGARMFHAFHEVFRAGYKKASLAGADIPELSAPIILKSIELLSGNDIVFGPAKDGGYYLIGMRKLIREIFTDVPWSSAQTLNRSVEHAKRCGYSVAFTEMLSDIDTIEDVKRAGLYK
ncbi:MAG: TIGR04282 family arsenosugar biosynthesis glycosyltransferase [Nitrospirae bacterium]|nr:TIGR04282 family arsenosugar biosynthesis glycosyltransferase [Nitrospirota bacterium]